MNIYIYIYRVLTSLNHHDPMYKQDPTPLGYWISWILDIMDPGVQQLYHESKGLPCEPERKRPTLTMGWNRGKARESINNPIS